MNAALTLSQRTPKAGVWLYDPSLAVITLDDSAGAFAMMLINHFEDTGSDRKLQAASAHAFNPTATMDVFLASSTRDLSRALSESDCDAHGSHFSGRGGHHGRNDYGHGPRIALGLTDKGRPALTTVGTDVSRGVADVTPHFACEP